MTEIAATAVVDKGAQLGQGVTIGPGCVVGPEVTLGDGCVLRANVVITGKTSLGAGNVIHANAVLGGAAQMLGDEKEGTELRIGEGNMFRENVTINRGSHVGSGVTEIGNHNFFMIGSHVGHDVEIEDHVMMGNYFQVAGHGKIETRAWLCPMGSIHQFVTVGRYAYLAGYTGASHDIAPYTRVAGLYPYRVRGLNLTGLERNGFSKESIGALQKAYRQLYRMRKKQAMSEALGEVEAANYYDDEHVKYLVGFLHRSHHDSQGRYREKFRK